MNLVMETAAATDRTADMTRKVNSTNDIISAFIKSNAGSDPNAAGILAGPHD